MKYINGDWNGSCSGSNILLLNFESDKNKVANLINLVSPNFGFIDEVLIFIMTNWPASGDTSVRISSESLFPQLHDTLTMVSLYKRSKHYWQTINFTQFILVSLIAICLCYALQQIERTNTKSNAIGWCLSCDWLTRHLESMLSDRTHSQ